MKKPIAIFILTALLTASFGTHAQQNNKPNIFDKANNAASRVSSIIAVFQPYLLKARQLFFDGKQLAGDIKNSAKTAFKNNPNNPNQPYSPNNGPNTPASNNQGTYPAGDGSYPANNSGSGSGSQNPANNNTYPSSQNNYPSGQSSSNQSNYPSGQNSTNNNSYPPGQNSSGNNTYPSNQNNPGYNNSSPAQNYLPGQSLPINNPSSVNSDGTGNWGNQNNGLYGNCLDAMTGTVVGMGDAAQTPTSVDLMFFAPADGQNTYYIMTPGFAKNNSTAGYMTEHTSDQVLQWSDVNESEVALTKLSIGQFNQIQNNSQIQSAVRNAQDYAGYYSSVGQKLDGQVLAVKLQMDNREVYALIAVIKQMGTSGSNGYLKIKIKSTGIDANRDGQVDANAYQR